MVENSKYQGSELVLFEHAANWKKYFSNQFTPYINGSVLEVGAGLGANTKILHNEKISTWVLLEPDTIMAEKLKEDILQKKLPANCSVQTGTIAGVSEQFDTIIYIDVLEHIENDGEEVLKATRLLKNGGHLIILSPAFQILFSPFDKEIGHFKRYCKKDFKVMKTKNLKLKYSRYLDSLGYFAAFLNKYVLQQKYPSIKQVNFWDKTLIPISKIVDKILFYSFGKSILIVWQKTK